MLRTIFSILGIGLTLASIHLLAWDEPGKTNGSVSIVEEKIPLRQALAKLTEQTKIPIVNTLPADEDPVLKLSIKDATFWEALDQIASAADAQVDLFQSGGRIGLVRRFRQKEGPKQQVSRSGPFRVTLRRWTAFNDFTTGARGSTAVFEVGWEPSVEPFYLDLFPHDVILKDDKAKQVDVPSGQHIWRPLEGGTRAVEFEVNLPSMPREAAHIGLLKGSFGLRGPSRMHDFRFRTPAAAQPTLADLRDYLKSGKEIEASAGQGLTTCSLGSITLSSATWTLRITTKLPPGGPPFDTNEQWWSNNEVYLQSLDGKRRLAPVSYTQVNATNEKPVVEYFFRDSAKGKRGDPEKWTLVFRAPASIVKHSIPFEFKNVPLP
jgi:hypothetical protein